MAAKKSGLTIAINGNAGGFHRTLRGVKRALRAFTRSFAGQMAGLFAVSKVVGFFSAMIDGFGKIEEASQRLGVSIERVQKLEYAAKQTGFGIDGMRGALQKLQKTAAEAATGNSGAAQAFENIGLSVEELRGLSPDQLLDKVAVALKNVDDPLERAAAQTKLFGKNGLELNEFLRDYMKLGNQAKNQGLIVDEKTVKAAADFGDAVTKIGQGFKAWVASVPGVKELLGYLTSFSEIVQAEGNAKEQKLFSREQAYQMAYDAIRQRGGEMAKSTALYYAAKGLGERGYAGAGTALTPEIINALNEELVRQGLGAFVSKKEKGDYSTLWTDKYVVSGDGVASKQLTPAEQEALRKKMEADRKAAKAEKQRLAENRKRAKEAAERAKRQKELDDRNKRVESVLGGLESSNAIARLRAESPALAEYYSRMRDLGGISLSAAENERLMRGIAEKFAASESPALRDLTNSTPRFIQAVSAGSIEAYKIRASAGGDIQQKQLDVAKNQAKDVNEIMRELKAFSAKNPSGSSLAVANL